MDINNALDELIRALRESEEYKNYEDAKEALKDDGEAHGRMDAYRAHAYRVSNLSVCREDSFDDMRVLMDERSEVMKNPAVKNYLVSEMKLCRMLQHVCASILEITDMEIDSFMDEI